MAVTPTGNITSDQFLLFFDEFSKVPKAKLDAFLGVASTRVAPKAWGTVTSYATALMAAHMLACAGGRGSGGAGGASGGALTSESVGDITRAFATVGEASSGDATLLTTRYGQEFVNLRNETIITFGVSGMTPVLGPVVPPPFIT